MSQFETLHQEQKSLFRETIQKYFLKVLSLIFKKNSLLYKEKIKFILNLFVGYISFNLKVFTLRIKYPSKLNVPGRHIFLLHTLNKFLKILKPRKINFFLLGGTLLGAVRQGSFADMRDLDLGIKEEEFPKLIDAIPLLINSGAIKIRKNSKKESQKRLQVLYPFLIIDISVYKKEKKGNNEIWVGEKDDKRSNNLGFNFNIKDLENLINVKAYGQEFLSPAKPEIYLEKVYGKNWRTPKFNSKINEKNFFIYENKNKN